MFSSATTTTFHKRHRHHHRRHSSSHRRRPTLSSYLTPMNNWRPSTIENRTPAKTNYRKQTNDRKPVRNDNRKPATTEHQRSDIPKVQFCDVYDHFAPCKCISTVTQMKVDAVNKTTGVNSQVRSFDISYEERMCAFMRGISLTETAHRNY